MPDGEGSTHIFWHMEETAIRKQSQKSQKLKKNQCTENWCNAFPMTLKKINYG